MRLTSRCLELLKLLRAAKWLTTSQVHRRFFADATQDAARKRLRKLSEAGYLAAFRKDRMSEAVFALGKEGGREMDRCGLGGFTLERKPPKQLEHLVGINDVRIAAELELPLSYFFACWELPGLGWRQVVIPDALFSANERTFAVEYDRGVESVRFFLKSKMVWYRRGLDGVPLAAVLVVTDSRARLESLARAVADDSGRVLYGTIGSVRERGMAAPVFFDGLNGREVAIV